MPNLRHKKEVKTSRQQSPNQTSPTNPLLEQAMKRGEVSQIKQSSPGKSIYVAEVKALLHSAVSSGRYETEIAPYLSDIQKVLAENILARKEQPNLGELARMQKMNLPNACSAIANIRKKLRRWQEGKAIRSYGGRYSRADSIKKLYESKIAELGSADAVRKRYRFTGIELLVIRHYLTRKHRQTQKEVAEKTGRSTIKISLALNTIENKLLGRHCRSHLMKKYGQVSDDGIRSLLNAYKEKGVDTYGKLAKANCGLYLVARERGILHRSFPDCRAKVIREIDAVVAEMSKSQPLSEILSRFTPVERDVIEKTAIMGAQRDWEKHFLDVHGIGREEVLRIAKNVLRKLNGLPTEGHTKTTLELRHLVDKIGPERMAEVRNQLNAKELTILDLRICAEKPDNYGEIAALFSVSKQCIAYHEAALAGKLKMVLEPASMETQPEDAVPKANLKKGTKFSRKLEELGVRLKETGKLEEFRSTLNDTALKLLDNALSLAPQSIVSLFGHNGNREALYARKRLVRRLERYLGIAPPAKKRIREQKYANHTPEALLEEAKKYDNRSACNRADLTLYSELKRRNLLDSAYSKIKQPPYRQHTPEALFSMAQMFRGRTDCRIHNHPLHCELKARGLLDAAFGERKKNSWTSFCATSTTQALLEEATNYDKRSSCILKDNVLYQELKKRNLLYAAYGEKRNRSGKLIHPPHSNPNDTSKEEIKHPAAKTASVQIDLRLPPVLLTREDALLEEAKQYPTRKDCVEKRPALYAELKDRLMIERAYGHQLQNPANLSKEEAYDLDILRAEITSERSRR